MIVIQTSLLMFVRSLAIASKDHSLKFEALSLLFLIVYFHACGSSFQHLLPSLPVPCVLQWHLLRFEYVNSHFCLCVQACVRHATEAARDPYIKTQSEALRVCAVLALTISAAVGYVLRNSETNPRIVI